MRALYYTGGSPQPLLWREVENLVLIKPTDALVRPLAVAACDLDRSIIAGQSPFPGEFMLGHEFTGEIVDLGTQVNELQIGDTVLASFQPSCGQCSRCHKGHSSVCQQVPNGTMYGIGETGGDWGGAIADVICVPWAEYNLVKLPSTLDPTKIASASDNLTDGLRGVDSPLQRTPGASVLIAGEGSISLYATLCAMYLGASEVTVASTDNFVLETAEKLGASCLEIGQWPERLKSHDITVDCTNNVEGLAAVLKSTAPYGECTSSSIFFGGAVSVPMFNLNMRGISFHTGRVNSATGLQRVLELLVSGLDPEAIDPAYWPFEQAIEGLLGEPMSRKVILHR